MGVGKKGVKLSLGDSGRMGRGAELAFIQGQKNNSKVREETLRRQGGITRYEQWSRYQYRSGGYDQTKSGVMEESSEERKEASKSERSLVVRRLGGEMVTDWYQNGQNIRDAKRGVRAVSGKSPIQKRVGRGIFTGTNQKVTIPDCPARDADSTIPTGTHTI